MNERIKLLTLEADEYCRDYVPDWTMDDYNKKFAELIVQECIDYCGENLSKTVGGALKIHFGIKQ